MSTCKIIIHVQENYVLIDDFKILILRKNNFYYYFNFPFNRNYNNT